MLTRFFASVTLLFLVGCAKTPNPVIINDPALLATPTALPLPRLREATIDLADVISAKIDASVFKNRIDVYNTTSGLEGQGLSDCNQLLWLVYQDSFTIRGTFLLTVIRADNSDQAQQILSGKYGALPEGTQEYEESYREAIKAPTGNTKIANSNGNFMFFVGTFVDRFVIIIQSNPITGGDFYEPELEVVSKLINLQIDKLEQKGALVRQVDIPG